MIQAAPLVLSFARAVPMLNKLVGAVGITELGNRVNNYIEKNPEESAKIVSMIMPTQGIANALKNKSSEDVEEVEETEEVTTGSGVEERIREILKEAGVEDADDRDLTDLPKDLEAKVMSGIAKSSTDRKKDMIEASAIIGLSGPGRERKKMIDEVAERYDEGGIEEITKPKYEGYKKFIRRRRADGGSIGIEVLFGPKRDNFRYGGDTMGGRNDRSRSSPGPDRSRVSAQQQSNHDRAMAAAQNDGPSFKDKVKSIITNPATQALGGAILTGGMNLAVPGALDKLNKARMIKNAVDYARYVAPDEAIEGELENIQTQGGIVPYADGGRVGLFMGGSPLDGQALAIYNSMNAYGFSDQEIADALAAQGLYTPGSTPVVEEPVTNIAPNIINQGGGDGPPNDPPKDPYGGLGYSSANFGLGNTAINKDAVMDYEADAYEIGRTPFGQLSKFGVTALNALKNIPTPINLARMAYESYKQKQIEKKAQEEAIARDIARDMQESNRASRTGGYQAGYDSDFMDGPSGGSSTGGSPGSSGPGGSDSMGSFARGGLATMFTRKR